MAAQEYEKDFSSFESIAEFRALLASADEAFVVPAATTKIGLTESRDAAYANCGAYVVRHCVELIALWDGKDSSIGGTAEVVGFQLDGIPAPYLPEHRAFDPSLTGPVLYVQVPRNKDGGPTPTRFVVEKLYPRRALADPAKAFENAKRDIERFNHDVVGSPNSEFIADLPVRDQAQRLANVYQRRSLISLFAVFASAFAAVIAFNAYASTPSHPFALLLTYLALVGAAFIPYRLSHRHEWQARHQDYRALEQLLQTAHFWNLAGIDESVSARFSESERTKIDWLAIALRALADERLSVSEPQSSQSDLTLNLRAIYEEWVLDQYRYFTLLAGKRERRRAHVSAQLATIFVCLSVAVTIGSYVFAQSALVKDHLPTVLFSAAMLAVMAALVHDFSEKRGWAEHSRHYDVMSALFGDARERIAPLLDRTAPETTQIQQIRSVLRALGEEAIRESVEWLNLHRSRPLNVPRV